MQKCESPLLSQLSEEDAVKAEEEGHFVAVEDDSKVDDGRLTLVHLLRGRGLLVLLLLLEHHSRILALVKLLWMRRRGLTEVPATAGRGCHHGVVGVLPLLDGNDTKRARHTQEPVTYYLMYYVSQCCEWSTCGETLRHP